VTVELDADVVVAAAVVAFVELAKVVTGEVPGPNVMTAPLMTVWVRVPELPAAVPLEAGAKVAVIS